MKKDKWKYVSVGKCVGAIIWSLIGLAAIFIPFALGGGNLEFTYTKLPFIGDSSIFENMAVAVLGLGATIGLGTQILDIIFMVMQYGLYAYLIIMAATVVFALLLAIISANALRIIFKLFSVIFGIALIVIGISFIVFVAGTIMAYLQSAGEGALEGISDMFLKTGVIYAFSSAIISFIIAGKQFKWFSKPY